MPFSYREFVCGGKTFCCCLPVRFGVISMSILGMLVAGALSIILWFEVSATLGMTTGDRAAFVLAGLVETFLFIASILGFVGAVVRKQLFIQTYAYFLYVHLIFNVGAAAYLLYAILHFQSNIAVKGCEETVQDPAAQEQCQGFLQITKIVYIVIAAVVLTVELYGAIIVTRYLNLIQSEKRSAHESRMFMDSAFHLKPARHDFIYTSVHSAEQHTPLYQGEFNPYLEAEENARLSRGHTPPMSQEDQIEVLDLRPPPPIEVGYGGGSWTHREISEEEKQRLQRETGGAGDLTDLTDEERTRRRAELKSNDGPPQSVQADIDPLPRYTEPSFLPRRNYPD